MKRLITILTLLTITLTALGQGNDSLVFHKQTFLFGLGLGTKSHLGNWGITSNLFVTKNLNIKLSVGGGQFNYNGFLLSVGPEYCRQIKKNKYLLLGSTWTITSDTYGVIDDESPAEREYRTKSNQYIRTYTGIAFVNERSVFKIEIGYSYALYTPTYILYKVWTPGQIEQVKRGMGSGLLFSFTVQGLFYKGKRKTI
jgi:hypothetical protein